MSKLTTFRIALGVRYCSIITGTRQCEDGWWEYTGTDSYTLLPDGSRADVTPFESLVRWTFDGQSH